jgi:hypothetical protein
MNGNRPHDLKPPYKWKLLHDDGGILKKISRRLFSGEFFFWLLYEIWEAEENDSYTGARVWRIDVCLIAPEKISREEWESNVKCVGGERWLEQPVTGEIMAEVIHDAGGARAPLFNTQSTSKRNALYRAKRLLETAMSNLRVTLDRPVNRIGTTGWEALEGNIMAGLTRPAATPEQERANKLMRKLSGIREDHDADDNDRDE